RSRAPACKWDDSSECAAVRITSIRFFLQLNNSLAFLEPVQLAMFSAVSRYLDRQQETGAADLPYKYCERTTLSLFAGGVWQSGARNFVLEEAPCWKISDGKRCSGREDIWFVADGKSCYAEAKQDGPCWPNLAGFSASQGHDIVASLIREYAAA